jgi:hypothetical protein
MACWRLYGDHVANARSAQPRSMEGAALEFAEKLFQVQLADKFTAENFTH